MHGFVVLGLVFQLIVTAQSMWSMTKSSSDSDLQDEQLDVQSDNDVLHGVNKIIQRH